MFASAINSTKHRKWITALVAAAVVLAGVVIPATSANAADFPVTGTITAAGTGEALGGVSVVLQSTSVFASTTTLADGSFAFGDPGIASGSYALTLGAAYASEYQNKTGVIEVNAATVINEQLVLGGGFTWRFTNAELSDRSSVFGSSVYKSTSEGWVQQTDARRIASGLNYADYRVAGLEAGTYRVGFKKTSTAPGMVLQPEFWNNKRSLNTANDIVVSAGTSVPLLDVTLDPFDPTTFAPRERIAGESRYDSGVQISRKSYPGTAPVVLIATGENYPDALSAGSLAAKLGGPLLLVPKSSLPASVSAEILRLKPASIIVVGGRNSVEPQVFDALSALSTTDRIERVDGATRYETSRNLVKKGWGSTGAKTLYVTTGQNFPDALSAAAAGGHLDAPVLLVNGLEPTLDADTIALISLLRPSQIKLAGGPASLSYGIEQKLYDLGSNTLRLAGATRYETSVAINQDAFPNATRAFVATGANFPDALAGSAWAGHDGSPLYTVPGTCIPQNTLQVILNTGVTNITLLGGPNALSDSVQALTIC